MAAKIDSEHLVNYALPSSGFRKAQYIIHFLFLVSDNNGASILLENNTIPLLLIYLLIPTILRLHKILFKLRPLIKLDLGFPV